MLLKRLSLVGFKSFADRTRLDFDAGVNVVVGPNGSGKSNLLDAIAWVMGTQAKRALRTERMEDVIFAGTATRPPLNRAEVSLTFDNADGFLPLDLAEVTITRRLLRDGTSEYEINGAPCRLLDIQELLSDGGVGRHQHVLVGQGQIGEILTARPEEHRAIIEEAAGIMKHRSRRDRAERRLEATDADVARLEDLLREKRRQLRPLRRQAEAAERYDSVKAEARAIRVWLGAEELRSLDRKSAAATTEQEELHRRLADDETELAALERRLVELRAAAGDVGRALQRDSAAAARLEAVVARLGGIASVARERRRAIEARIEGADRRREDLRGELVDLEGQLAEATEAATRSRAALEKAEATLAALEDEEQDLAEQLRLPAEGLVANLRGDLRALEASGERDRREREAITRRISVLEVRRIEQDREREELDAALLRTDAEVGAAQAAYERARTERRRAQELWEAAEARLADARVALAAAEAKVEAILGALEGLGDPEARRRAEAMEEILGPVVARLDVPEDVAAAVDGALAGWADALVVADRPGMRRVVAALKREGLGAVNLVTGDAGDASAVAAAAARLAAGLGLERLVDRLGPRADRELAERLLGDVVYVEGWSTAWEVVERDPAVRAVTPEGDVVTGAGMRVGAVDGAGHAALEAARVTVERAERELARAESVATSARRTFEATRAEEREALEALEALEARLSGHTEALDLIDRARADHDAELERLRARLAALDEAERAREDRLRQLRARLAELEGEEAERQAAWEALQRRRQEVARRRVETRRRRDEAATVLAKAEERRRLVVERREAVAAELAELDELPDHDERVDELARIEATAQAAIAVLEGHLGVLRERQRELRERTNVAGGELEEAERRKGELEAAIRAARDRLAVLSVELAEFRVRREAVAEALRRDADVDEETALAASRPDLPEDEDLEARLASLEADLRRMGPINALAAAEYAEVAAEVELLEGQLGDLEESRRELRKVIAALDDEMAKAFMAAFDDIARYYEEHFRLVFPGGRGTLVLTDPERPLETGVEVRAQPAGKKIGRLSLLSGGERSLAALAFLFAVFRARPSPFYVLDEVEAALDDANLRRFLRLVDGLRSSAQLVIITHQQQTMEAADVLYGVTMEPGASSKVIAKRMQPASA